VITKIKRILFR